MYKYACSHLPARVVHLMSHLRLRLLEFPQSLLKFTDVFPSLKYLLLNLGCFVFKVVRVCREIVLSFLCIFTFCLPVNDLFEEFVTATFFKAVAGLPDFIA